MLNDDNAPGGTCDEDVRDDVSRPAHYTHSRVEPIDVIEAWRLGFHLGNVVKYIARADHKGSRLADLKKARWYLERAIALQERTREITRGLRELRDAVPMVSEATSVLLEGVTVVESEGG